ICDSGDLVDWISGLSSSTGSDVSQAIQSFAPKALAPENHRISIGNNILDIPGAGRYADGWRDRPW
ncbi:MAG: hypothetical protein M3Y27_09165, partial [Acidobacteriota bacterium]|nr:hypothetical protein [Acidobacteriota bacterium]